MLKISILCLKFFLIGGFQTRFLHFFANSLSTGSSYDNAKS